ncbi:MAG TPA: adenylyl-sulfate kinase [Nitrospirota bacterium]
MSRDTGFAVWITGLPASGKSTIARELVKQLAALNMHAVVLESDEMRRILTPEATYSSEERDRFYRMMTLIGNLLVRQNVNVIFDATANRRAYCDYARGIIPRFMEVHVRCPLELCMKRDPKGIYSRAAAAGTGSVPGMQVPYETPLTPDAAVDGQGQPEVAAKTIIAAMRRLLHI